MKRLIKKADIDTRHMTDKVENVRRKLHDLKLDVEDLAAENIDGISAGDKAVVAQHIQEIRRNIGAAMQELGGLTYALNIL